MQHFQVEVPRRAGICPILLNAIFALSARHLSHIGNYDSFASNRYHDECLKYLIPMLNNTATISDETLFAATIILRVLEEIDLPDSDLQGHMLGIQVFVGARDPYAIRGGLSEAAFWVGLRQEIYVATVKQKSVKINLDQCLVDRSVEPASDFEWANRAVVHYADVLNCCFGPEGVAFSKWVELKDYSEKWQEMKPSSFTPIFYREANAEKREAFPEVWYSHACHSKLPAAVPFSPLRTERSSHWCPAPQTGANFTRYLRPQNSPSRWQPQYSNKINGGMLDRISVRSLQRTWLIFHRSRSNKI
jgi:hypothetical protein